MSRDKGGRQAGAEAQRRGTSGGLARGRLEEEEEEEEEKKKKKKKEKIPGIGWYPMGPTNSHLCDQNWFLCIITKRTFLEIDNYT